MGQSVGVSFSCSKDELGDLSICWECIEVIDYLLYKRGVSARAKRVYLMKQVVLLFTLSQMFFLPVMAHHSFNAEFDRDTPVLLTGVLTGIEWQNPHIWYYIDVTDEDGNVENWGISGGSPGMLMRRGIYKSVLEIGMTISVEGFRARDGSNNAGGRRVTHSDGSDVFTAGPAAGRSIGAMPGL